MARLAVRMLLAYDPSSPAVDSEGMHHGALDVVDASKEAEFHKFLSVDAAPIGWGATLVASVLAAIQVRGGKDAGRSADGGEARACVCGGA